MTFADLIYEKGYDIATFYRLVGLDRQVIYNYVNGKAKPSLKNIKKIAKTLNVSTDTVIDCFVKEMS